MTVAITPGHKGADAMIAALRGRSLWDDARRRLFRNKAAVAGMVLLLPTIIIGYAVKAAERDDRQRGV